MRIMLTALLMLGLAACATEGRQVNEAARDAGEAVGRVGKIPSSLGEGFGDGMAPETDDGPYDRSQQK